MVNHARSLDRRGYRVSLLGLPEPPSGLSSTVRVFLLDPLLRDYAGTSKLLYFAVRVARVIMLSLSLTARLIAERPRWILVQNPPSFPTLLAAWLCARVTGGRLIVDWHNYGYTMLALRLGKGHPLVRLHRWYDGRAGRLGDAHLCVSVAMRDDLARRWGIDARVLYDRPVEFLAAATKPAPSRRSSPPDLPAGANLVAVYPTGWTADENAGLLLEALRLLPSPAGLRLYLTGTGPLRDSFDAPIASLRAGGFDIVTGFLPEAEYREVIRGADLGLSLHTSSSGLDLAMKVSDLFAARVPVCAWDYGVCLREQIRDGVTGFFFQTAPELAALLSRFVADPGQLAEMRKHIEVEWRENWDEAWEHAAQGLLT